MAHRMTRWMLTGALIIIALTTTTMVAQAATISVCQSGCNYTRIQSAITAAVPGDIIEVHSGTYYENVNVNKQLTVQGVDTGGGKPVVNAGGDGSAITLSTDGIRLDGFRATNSCDWGTILDQAGIIAESSKNNIITNNTANNNKCGIVIGTNNNTITDNNANDNRMDGIRIWYLSDNNVIANNTANNNVRYGMVIYKSGNNILRNNQFNGNRYNFMGTNFYNDIDKTNTVDGKPIYCLTGTSDTVIDSSSNAGTVYCFNCNNITVKDMTLMNNGAGIYFYNTSNSKVKGNNLTSNSFGIFLSSSSNNTITNNIANNNGRYGIYLGSSGYNNLSENTVHSTGIGIGLWSSNYNNLIGNTASNNWQGILLSSASNSNTLSLNKASSNHLCGITIQCDANNNKIYLNNFMNNSESAMDTCTNQWDNGTIGNHFSNFDEPVEGCTDADGDGICDLGYNIHSGSNVDMYPLVSWSDPEQLPNIGFGYPTTTLPGQETELTVIVDLTEISMNLGDPVQWYVTTPGGETITGESDTLKCCLVGGLYDRAYYDFPESGTYTIRVEFPGYTEYAEWDVEVAAPPTVTITSPAAGTIVSTSTVTIAGTASSDTSSVASVTVNGVPATGTTNWNADVSLVEGENIITVVAKDLENNKRTVKLQLFYYAHEDIHPIFSNVPHVEVGGTFYKWYKTTFQDSVITIDSNYLDYSQPDENGVFNVSVNTSKHGITSPGTVDVLTHSASITKNGQTMQADTSLFNFTLNVLPRNYSTSWYLGSTIGGGGGIVLYVEGEENADFTMTTGNQDSILLMNRDINNKGTIGVTAALFEAEAPGVNFEAVQGDIHGSVQEIYGSQANVDYENAKDAQKLESSLYILTSTIPHGTNPMMAKTIDTVLDELTADLTTDYYESGIGISGGGGVDILKVGFGLESTEEPERAKIGCAKVGLGLGFEAGASLKNRTYPTIDSQEYLIQYVYSAEDGLSGSVLGNDIVNWGKSEYMDATVIMGQDTNKVLYGKVKIKDNEKQVESDHVTRELTYDYGPIADENIINPFESDTIDTVSAFGKFIKNDKSFNQGNITVVETRGQKLAIELPLGLTIWGVKLSINPGIRMGNASNYLTDKQVIHNKESYALEKYVYDTHVQGSAEKLTHILESLLEPVETVMEKVIETIKDRAEKGKKIIFSTGKIIFNIGTQFFTKEDVSASTVTSGAISSPSMRSDQTPEIIISTYTPNEPAHQTMAVFGAMGVSSGYATSLSGGDFVIGNITDMQPYNVSFTPAAQLTLNYTEGDVAGIDESNISIYRWDTSNNSWMPLSSIVNTIENIVITNITRFGTYAIGYDRTNPVIEWNASDLYQGNITVEAIITDTGSGINTSAIRVYLDGNEQNFTYNIFSGLLKSAINTSVDDHVVRIYAEDTSGNSNATEKLVASIEPVVVKYLQINYIANDTIELSWTGENGTYSIRNYLIYRNAELIANTTQTNFTIRSTDSTTYMIYPVDANGNAGIGKAISYRMSQLIPQFTHNWENTLYPTAGCPITFDATGSHLINGTIETNITTYTWIFNGDVNNTESGKIINHTFTDDGLHKVTLQIEDDNQNSATLTKIVNITASTKGDLNHDGILTSADAAIALQIAASGSWDPAADVNHDNHISSLDALMILQAAAGRIEL